MKKKLRVLPTFVIILALFLTACNGNESSPEKGDEKPPANESPTEKTEITISAAGSLTEVAEEIAESFTKENEDITVAYNFGSSGKLSQQIQQGAPADVFLSASKKDMDFLAENELIVDDSRIDFASNKLVVITEKSSDIELPTLEDIATIDIANIALGDIDSTPFGRYGKESLENIQVWEKIESKMAYVSTVNQAVTHVEQGNAEIGIVFNTDALRADKVKVIAQIDSNLHAPIIYPAAVVKASEQKAAAQVYLDFLKSEKGKSILESHGFIVK